MINIKLLKAQLVLNDLSVAQLCEKMNWSITTGYNRINGLSDFSVREMQKLEKILSLSPELMEAIFFPKNLD